MALEVQKCAGLMKTHGQGPDDLEPGTSTCIVVLRRRLCVTLGFKGMVGREGHSVAGQGVKGDLRVAVLQVMVRSFCSCDHYCHRVTRGSTPNFT